MKIAVIGSGTMGIGLVQIFSQAHFVSTVIWIFHSEDAYTKSYELLQSNWNKAIEKNKFNAADILIFESKIQRTFDYKYLSQLDFVIEAVSENIDIKKNVFSKASNYISPTTVFASNTSSLSITEIASVAKYKDKVIGLHFFNPAPIMVLTEIVSGMLTSHSTRNFSFELTLLLGKKAVFVNEAPGFVVNRMLIPMINEAIGVLAEGVATAEDIDSAMIKGANHPIGPLSLSDLIGNDICLSIMEVLHNETGDPKYRAHPLLRKMVRANKLGRKSGEGFFSYKL